MKRFFLAAVSVLALSGAVRAADLPAKAPAYEAPVNTPYNWTGLYVGGVIGYGWGTSKHCDGGSCSLLAIPPNPAANPQGLNGGVTLGYNWQVANWVLGVEGDWSGANLKGSSPTVPGFGCLGSCDTKITSFETIRGRVGYAFDRILPYVTAGIAFTQLEASLGSPVVLGSGSTTKSSFTFGGGVEYGLAPNWSTKLEYLYVSKLSDFIYGPRICLNPGCFVSDVRYSVVRLGVNYRFNGI